MNTRNRIRPHIAEIEPYQPPDLEEVAARAGLSIDQLIRLNANENPYGPSPRVAQVLGHSVNFAQYPYQRPLQHAVADYAGVAPEQVVLGHGSNELIDLLMRLLLEPGEGLVVCPPTFSMYRFFARVGRHPVWNVPRRDDFGLDAALVEALPRACGEERPRMLFLVSPGNPDGQVIPLYLIERFLRLPWTVVVDEAYIEFGGPSALPLLSEHDNLVILRTFSKWAGLAGLRVGYALATAELAGYLARIRAPFNVNSAAVVAALTSLDDLEAVQANVGRLIAERERLQEELATIPFLEPIPSQANFVLCRVRGRTGHQLATELATQGILVRSFSEPRLAHYVRITVGRPEENRALQDALRALPDNGRT